MGRHQKPAPLKHCEHCATQLVRKRYPNGALESLLHFGRRKYCDQQCMGAAFDAKPSQSEGWSTSHYHARKLVAAGQCEICGKPDATDVHHRDGNHLNNSPANLARICRGCHIRLHRPRGSCTICGEPQKGLGFCEKHYQRFKKHGDPLVVKDNQFVSARLDTASNPKRICAMSWCKAPSHANGYCGKHAQQVRRGRILPPQSAD